MRWIEPQRLFVITALVVGTWMALMVPPFQAPDEQHHFFRAYQISEGHLVARWRHNLGVGNLPLSLDKIWEPFTDVRYNRTTTSLATIRDALRIPLNPSERANYIMHFAYYSPLAYMPQALAILIGRVLNWPPLFLMYFARLANLWTWTALGYWALRIAPGLGRPLLLLMLMPMSIFLAASVSADAMPDGFSFVLAALAYRVATQEDQNSSIVRWSWVVMFIVCASALTLPKSAYLPIAGLIFLIPLNRLGAFRRRITIFSLLALATIVPIILWSRQTPGLDTVIPFTPPGTSPRLQSQFLIAHPISLLTIPLYSAQYYNRFILYTFVGALGWLDIQLSPLFVVAYLIALVFACRLGADQPRFQRPWRVAIVSALVSMAATEALLLLLYLVCTTVGAPDVDGIQGRYFIPIASVLLLFFTAIWHYLPANFRSHRSEYRRNITTAIIAIIGCGYALIMLYCHYYISIDVGSLSPTS